MNYFTKVKKLILDSLGFFLENIEQRYIQIKNIVNNLNSTDTDKPLSSKMGNDLANRISNTVSNLGNLGDLHSNYQRPSSVVLALNRVIGFLDGKANIKHADPSGSNGIGDVDVYGHVMVSDNLDDYYVPGKVASTHSLKLINDKITELNSKLKCNGTVTKIQSISNNTPTKVTIQEDGWYYVRALNSNVSGSCQAYMLDSNNVEYLSANAAPNSQYVRATTAPIYLEKGSVVYCKSFHTDNGALFKLN